MQQESPSSEPVYVISVAARLAGLPCWVLRVLDQEEIVVPARTESNRRLYSDQDIAILARVRHWTEVRGVNIAGVKVILELELQHLVGDSDTKGGDGSSPAGAPATERLEDQGAFKGLNAALAVTGHNTIVPYNSKK